MARRGDYTVIPGWRVAVLFIVGIVVGFFVGLSIIISLLTVLGSIFGTGSTIISDYPVYVIPILLLVFYLMWRWLDTMRYVALGILLGILVAYIYHSEYMVSISSHLPTIGAYIGGLL